MKFPYVLKLAVVSALLNASIAAAQTDAEAVDTASEEEEALSQLSPEIRAKLESLKAAAEDIEANGETLEKLDKLGDLYLEIGEVQRAVLVYEKAIATYGGSEELFVKFARVLGLAGRAQLTVDTLKIGLQQFPDSELLQFELGKQYVRMQKGYAAVANLKGLVDANPDIVEYRFYLADAYRLQKKWDVASALLDEVIEKDASHAQAKLMKGDIQLAKGEYRDAVSYLEDVYEANPEAGNAKALLVHAYQFYAYAESKEGRFDPAIESIRDALEIDPKNPESMIALGTILKELGKNEEATAAFEAAVEENPNHLEVYLMYGKLLESIDRASDAAEVYKKGLAKARELGVERAVETYRALLSGKG